MEITFGETLKQWRGLRRMSQLDLGLAANVSARHISFLETGRARPSRPMILQLAETLDVPRAERNRMLTAAGFRAAYETRPFDEAEMWPVDAAIDRIIERHDPYPAFVFDRHWTLLRANMAGRAVAAILGIGEGESFLEAMTKPDGLDVIENRDEVVQHMLARLSTESAYAGGDAVLDAAIARLAADPAARRDPDRAAMPAVVPVHFRIGGQRFSLFSVIAQFGSAEDIALADLRIELFFPADEATRKALESMVSA